MHSLYLTVILCGGMFSTRPEGRCIIKDHFIRHYTICVSVMTPRHLLSSGAFLCLFTDKICNCKKEHVNYSVKSGQTGQWSNNE